MSDFIVGSAEHLFSAVVIPQYQEFLKNNADIKAAVCTIILSYHLYEWVNGQSFNKDDFLKQYPENNVLAEYFDYSRKITNGVKHGNPKIKTKTQIGFSSAFSSAFARPLNVVTDEDETVSVDELLKVIIEYWKQQMRLIA
ncbi:hypothetical protein SAMN04488518_109240 [Pseudovibrio ascidiaceicola]|uniref:RiboL-PSP-HEPN domain-containing protein n=1 Tax=Pseudovibrio ascidiaceicola TaxID=285279 RepID=A0A1I4CMX1_9HYPH|nr:hypothetical protein [Pseudovibrio ascidiaceicola]SFK82093.1 hypothetical protein SAMN04488518_109240 [Pseudovibrio ascidiaceicola]